MPGNPCDLLGKWNWFIAITKNFFAAFLVWNV
jgi:hypothetical protein